MFTYHHQIVGSLVHTQIPSFFAIEIWRKYLRHQKIQQATYEYKIERWLDKDKWSLIKIDMEINIANHIRNKQTLKVKNAIWD